MASSTLIESDAALMQQVASGDSSACRLLASRHLDHSYRMAYRITGNASHADDIAQEAFLRLWKAAPKWQPKAQIKTWLHRVIYNLSIDRLRQENRYSDAEMEDIMDTAPDPWQAREKQQLKDRIASELQKLPPRQRAAITLVHFEECGNIEAADIMKISVDALESLLARGRQKLRELLLSARADFEGGVG